MENSAKALIIAGAVLIAVLVSSLAVTLFSSAGQYSEGNRNQQYSVNITNFNARFDQYIGSNKSKSTVQKLLRLIESNNSDLGNVNISCNVIKIDSDAPSKKYNVTSTYNDEGYINHIEIN